MNRAPGTLAVSFALQRSAMVFNLIMNRSMAARSASYYGWYSFDNDTRSARIDSDDEQGPTITRAGHQPHTAPAAGTI